MNHKMKEYIPNPVDTGHIPTPEGVGIFGRRDG